MKFLSFCHVCPKDESFLFFIFSNIWDSIPAFSETQRFEPKIWFLSIHRDTQQLSDSGRFHFRSYSSLIRWMLNKETRHTASTSNRWYFAFELCCHNNETLASIANPPNSAQLERTPIQFPKLHSGPRSSVGMRRATDTQPHRRLRPLYISPRILLTQIVTKWIQLLR